MNGFNKVADLYDELFSDSSICFYQRNIVWRYLEENLATLQHILETNCGTGEDAVHLCSQGHYVTATDGAENMIRIAQEKLNENNLQKKSTIFLWDLNQPYPKEIDTKFDVVYSNFGGWNCLDENALLDLAPQLYALIKPGGKLIVILLSKFCLQETLYYLLKFNFKNAFRRFGKGPVEAKLTHNAYIDTWYYSAAKMKKFMSPYFKFVKKRPAGFFVPPSYLENFFAKRPRLLRSLYYMDMKTRHLSFLTTGADQMIIEFERI